MGIRILFISRKKITVQSSPNQAQSVGTSCSHSTSLNSWNTRQMWPRLRSAATDQDPGLVGHCLYFQLQLPHHKNLHVVLGFCWVWSTRVATLKCHRRGPCWQPGHGKRTSHRAVPSSVVKSPGVPRGHGNTAWKSQFCHWQGRGEAEE